MKNTTKKSKVFNTYEEAMENLFPKVWKEEKRKEKEKRKRDMSMEDLAESLIQKL